MHGYNKLTPMRRSLGTRKQIVRYGSRDYNKRAWKVNKKCRISGRGPHRSAACRGGHAGPPLQLIPAVHTTGYFQVKRGRTASFESYHAFGVVHSASYGIVSRSRALPGNACVGGSASTMVVK